MKKGKTKFIVIIVIVIVILALILGLYLFNKNNTEVMEEALTQASADYFDKYVSVGTDAYAYKVTLEMLKEANENGENYDLSSLDNCETESTYATLNIDYNDGSIKETEVKLDCDLLS